MIFERMLLLSFIFTVELNINNIKAKDSSELAFCCYACISSFFPAGTRNQIHSAQYDRHYRKSQREFRDSIGKNKILFSPDIHITRLNFVKSKRTEVKTDTIIGNQKPSCMHARHVISAIDPLEHWLESHLRFTFQQLSFQGARDRQNLDTY
jgi:hypothetical protein